MLLRTFQQKLDLSYLWLQRKLCQSILSATHKAELHKHADVLGHLCRLGNIIVILCFLA